jgi:primosomal protein N' (replication factor Y) (superfamily II helicase)
MGVRCAVFAPLRNLGLIIVEEEENFVYKQDQSPHYHARDVALMRAKIDNADIILGSASPSLEVFYLAEKKKIGYIGPEGRFGLPEVKIVDTGNYRSFTKKKRIILSKFLEDAVFSALGSKEKALLFLNRRGFATMAMCLNCGIVLKCPRCSINLVYHLKDNEGLHCRYCNFKMPAPKICPHCNSGYIKYSGAGTERIENELAALFPSAVIKRIEGAGKIDLSAADIFVTASAAIKDADMKFGVVGVLSIDNCLNYASLRSSERAFGILSALARLTDKKMIIQSALPGHHCFQALLKREPALFCEEELRQRKELRFPPYRHLILVKLRGKKQERIRDSAGYLFEKFNKCRQYNKGVKILSLNPGSPPKLRDNFYWQILLSCGSLRRAVRFLKFNLKDFPHSGIIVTVDVDPV